MSDLVAELPARAQALPREDGARLAQELLASLDPRVAEIEAAWSDELRRRIDEIDSGAVALVPADEAFGRVRQALRR